MLGQIQFSKVAVGGIVLNFEFFATYFEYILSKLEEYPSIWTLSNVVGEHLWTVSANFTEKGSNSFQFQQQFKFKQFR